MQKAALFMHTSEREQKKPSEYGGKVCYWYT